MATGTRTIAVCGATGRQGGAVARSLLGSGWAVRAVSRHPGQERAVTLSELGAEVVAADMEDSASLRRAFEGVDGVFSVQNGLISGFDREVVQGRNVADAAKHAKVGHLVYAAAGTGQEGFGIPSWEAKLEVEDHMRGLDLPFTSLRPQALMELMTDKSYYPAMGTWRIWPRLSGEDRPIAWMAAEDVGAIATIVFAQPDDYIGQNLLLVTDVRSLAECRTIYREIIGRAPSTFPMPIWLFDQFTKKDVTAIWRWVRTGTYPTDTASTRAIHPSALTVREWLGRVRDRQLGGTKTETGRVEHG